MNICPPFITEAGLDSSNWTAYSTLDKALACNYRPRLLEFMLHSRLTDVSSVNLIRAAASLEGDHLEIFNTTSSSPGTLTTTTENDLVLGWVSTDEQVITPQAVTALKEAQSFLLTDTAVNKTTVFVHYGDTAVGVFFGKKIMPTTVATEILERLVDYCWEYGMPRKLATQLCSSKFNSDYTLGVVIDNTPGPMALINVQSAVSAWSNATCLEDLQYEKPFGKFDIEFNIEDDHALSSNLTTSIHKRHSGHNHIHAQHHKRYSHPVSRGDLIARASCSVKQVVSGDTCAALASRCGISASNFTKYNTKTNLCSTLRVGQYVCCSSGTLPDFTPKPNADGSCSSYEVQTGDFCDAIAASHSIEVKDIESFNKNTWGWSGCTRLFADAVICLSKGDAPMPNPIANAQCGPQKPGTVKPAKGKQLADLNPCPLNACCNVWGQCGTTSDFCTNTTLGAPGTAKAGTNGCISNCGTEIVNNDSPPSSFIRVGYFEAWNNERPCLWMDASELQTMTSLTHIHFAFARLTANFQVDISHVSKQFNKFKKLTGVKRVLAFGGWVDSTDPGKFHILRNAVKKENRLAVAKNIAAFIKEHGLDGVDMDWEYPGAPDIPDIPAADVTDGTDYLGMLTLLKAYLGTGKTLSIAAPASFWYLKAYPIEKMGKLLDYIIYMTYDLHGQWDYDNEWASPGCAKGNCLRSHINMTETINSLAMITKAGVPSSKVIVGITSYGRSFKMAKAGCTGPMCTFLGSATESPARKGACTATGGYISNAEINDIIKRGKNIKTFVDDSESDILVYDNTEWVAYMSASRKNSRISKYKGLNFGGVTDWAVDLEKFGKLESGGGNYIEIIEDNPTCEWKWLDGYTCQDEAVKDALMNAEKRWNAMQTPCPWREVTRVWYERRDDEKNPINVTLEENQNIFAMELQSALDGDENFRCASIDLGTNSCEGTLECRQTVDAGPAAYFILNSMSVLHTTIRGMYDSIGGAENKVQNYIGTMVKKFAPDVDDTAEFNLLMDVLGIVIGMGFAPIFNRLIKGNGNVGLEDWKDLVVNGASWAATVAKDFQNKETDGTLVEAKLGNIASDFEQTLELFLKEIFSGSDRSVDYIGRMIADGKLNNPRKSPGVSTFESSVAKTFYAILIPFAWKIGAVGAPAFIVDSGYSCDAVGPLDKKYITSETAEETEFCYEKQLYYLLAPKGPAETCKIPDGIGPQLPVCVDMFFSSPDGLTNFNDTANWEGLTADDLVAGAIEGWRANGKMNTGKFIDLTDKDSYVHLESGESYVLNVRAPGIVQIPVCSPEQARAGWLAAYKMTPEKRAKFLAGVPSWPCPIKT
ncbi:hypothetical protein B0J13DRAFT_592197 [Dactylonectria estremocensis]|uniref:chitinase n=1 Tax=Dactylonectria estremocensis TaxID=1079267 RepID=A0A9P9FBY7_9HYPO|nr:hypothetical protein B0J13DRAFT_592197 [Dactylonectria estremocensis]